MKSIYSHIHKVMLRSADNNLTLRRRKAIFVISRFNVPRDLREIILEEMVKMKLLEKINAEKIRLIVKEI